MDPMPVEEPSNEDETESEWRYDLLVDCLLAFGVALNVYFIVDAATEGALSQRIHTVLANARSHVYYLTHRNNVIRDAHEALYDDTQGENEK